MHSSGVRYHKSNEKLDDDGRINMRPLTVGYCRFTILERVLVVLVGVLFVLVLVLGILYGNAKANSTSQTTKQKQENEGTPCSKKDNQSNTCLTPHSRNISSEQENEGTPCSKKDNQSNTCLTAQCVHISSDIMKSLDWTINPCNNFYKFSCSKWLESHDIPGSSASFGQFDELSQENNDFMKAKLENQETLNKYKNSAAVSKALIDYLSCMEAEKTQERLGFQPLFNLISQYGSWNITDPNWGDSKWEFITNLVDVHKNLLVMPLFTSSVEEDLRNSSNHIMKIFPTQSWFFSRETYLQNTTYYNTIRAAYKKLMVSVITKLANSSTEDPDILRQIEDIYDFERRLAQISLPQEQARKIEELYKKVTIKELQKYTGKTFNWLDYFQRIFQEVNVNITEQTVVALTQLDYFRNMSTILGSTNDVVLGNYIIWTMIRGMRTFLVKTLRDDFQEYKKSFLKTRNERPRWQICLQLTQIFLGLPLSMLYLHEKFGENQMKKVEEMVSGIREEFIQNLQNISWMDEETKKAALKKARAITENVGYPKIIHDQEKFNKRYEELEIDRNDYFGNVMRKYKFAAKKKLEKILQPVDKSEWSFSPVDVNAYYSPTENKIVFPAGVLQPPFFDGSRPKALNYGAIGMVIGHELTHSFDNKGRKYDENGNLADWWRNSSVVEFKKRTECLEKKYSNYTFRGFKVNGRNTLGENIADNGGIKQAFQAYEKWIAIHGEEPTLPGLNLTSHQLFFIGFSQIWCNKYSDAVVRPLIIRSSHAPTMIRVLGSLANFHEFSKAFQCPPGSRMNPVEKCNLW